MSLEWTPNESDSHSSSQRARRAAWGPARQPARATCWPPPPEVAPRAPESPRPLSRADCRRRRDAARTTISRERRPQVRHRRPVLRAADIVKRARVGSWRHSTRHARRSPPTGDSAAGSARLARSPRLAAAAAAASPLNWRQMASLERADATSALCAITFARDSSGAPNLAQTRASDKLNETTTASRVSARAVGRAVELVSSSARESRRRANVCRKLVRNWGPRWSQLLWPRLSATHAHEYATKCALPNRNCKSEPETQSEAERALGCAFVSGASAGRICDGRRMRMLARTLSPFGGARPRSASAPVTRLV